MQTAAVEPCPTNERPEYPRIRVLHEITRRAFAENNECKPCCLCGGFDFPGVIVIPEFDAEPLFVGECCETKPLGDVSKLKRVATASGQRVMGF